MVWKAGEREFLIYVALNGPSDQRTVADVYSLAAPTVNLAKDSLVERGYIALRGRETGKRGAPRKIYGLTPAGLLAAVHEGDLWGNAPRLMDHWGDVAPVFIRSYEALWRRDFGGDAKRYCEASLVENMITIESLAKEGTHLRDRTPENAADIGAAENGLSDPWTNLLRAVDRGFYAEMHRLHGGPDRDRYLGTVRDDGDLLEGWLRWFRWEEKRFSELEEHRRTLLNDHHQ